MLSREVGSIVGLFDGGDSLALRWTPGRFDTLAGVGCEAWRERIYKARTYS